MQRLFEAFAKEGKELYLVGGAVRDLALGHPLEDIDDLDFCTNALPQETLEILRRHNYSIYDVGLEFGTVGTVIRNGDDIKDCQITTYRSEAYYRRTEADTEVIYGTTLAQDLARRDLSINSIAMGADLEYIDPYDGLRDIQERRIRVVSDPYETLAEDPLRILRVARFVSKLGFTVDPALEEACVTLAPRLLDVSHERWFIEMTKLLLGAHAPDGMEVLRRTGALRQIFPELDVFHGFHETCEVHHKDLWAHILQVLDQAERTPALRWGALLHDLGKVETREVTDGRVTFHRHEERSAELVPAIAKRFTFDNALTKEVKFICAHHGRLAQYDAEWSDAAVRRLVRHLDPYVSTMLSFGRADLTTSIPEKRAAALARIDHLESRIQAMEAAAALRPVLPSGLGNDLMTALELAPGRVIGQLKRHLEEEIIEGNLESGRDSDYYVAHLRNNPPEFLL